jgi:hypothetical protein
MTVAIFLFRIGNMYTVGVAPGGDLQDLVVQRNVQGRAIFNLQLIA